MDRQLAAIRTALIRVQTPDLNTGGEHATNESRIQWSRLVQTEERGYLHSSLALQLYGDISI